MIDENVAKECLKKGLELLHAGKPDGAVKCFGEMLIASEQSALAFACLGLSMARAGKDLATAEKYCLMAIKKRPEMGEFYRTLSEVYSIQGKKAESIEALEKGLKSDKGNVELYKEMRKYGIRKKPIIPFLPRSNFFNRNIGRILSSLKPNVHSH